MEITYSVGRYFLEVLVNMGMNKRRFPSKLLEQVQQLM